MNRRDKILLAVLVLQVGVVSTAAACDCIHEVFWFIFNCF